MLLVVGWEALDLLARGKKCKHTWHQLRQVFFVCVAIGVAVLVDLYVLDAVCSLPEFDWLPRGVFQILLLPTILLLMSRLVGPSDPILVAPTPGNPSKRL